MCPFLGIFPQNPSSAAALCFCCPSPGSELRPGTAGYFLPFGAGAALGALGAVLRPALHAVGHAHRIQSAAHHVITNARQILHTAAADEHDRVLLQVVADAGNVGGDLNPVGKPDAGNLAQGRVRLLGRLRVHAGANTAPLRRSLQGRRSRLVTGGRAPLADKLIKSRQTETPYRSKNRQHPNSNSRAQALRAVLVLDGIQAEQAQRSPIVTASRLPSFQSQTRTGTVAARFPAFGWKSRLRFAVPARIALQGGERADADAMYFSTPLTKTCRWGPAALRKKKATFGDLSGQLRLAWPGDQPAQCCRIGLPRRIQR